MTVSVPTCQARAATVTVNVTPRPSANAGAPVTLCQASSGPTVFNLNGSVANGTPLWTLVNPSAGLNATLTSGANTNTPTINVTGAGTVTARLTATGSGGCAGVSVTSDVLLTVTPTPTITTATALPGGTQGQPYNQAIAASGGSGAFNFSVTGGALPQGLQLDPGTGALNGTPGNSGSFNFTITVTAGNCSASRTFSLNITAANNPPTITANALTRQAGSPGSAAALATVADADQAVSSLQVNINNGPSATVNGVTVANLSINAAGSVTADVSAACGAMAATFTLSVTDSAGASVSTPLTVTVNANTPPTLSYGNQSVTAGGTLTVNPASGPSDNGNVASITLGSAPAGFNGALSVDNTTGAVTINNSAPAGSYTVRVRAADNCNAVTEASFTLVVGCPTLTLGPETLPNGVTGTPYSRTFSINDTGYTYSSAGRLPTGLQLDAIGLLSGTPTEAGTFMFAITALAAANGCSARRDYSVTITAPGFEADVSPRPGGDGQVELDDYRQIALMWRGLSGPLSRAEFQRADCAPRQTKGDGQIELDDYIQAGRYFTQRDPLSEAGGPDTPTPLLPEVFDYRQGVLTALVETVLQQRTIRMGQATVNANGTVSVPLELVALGMEHSLSLSLNYDTNLLSNPVVGPGSGAPAGASVFDISTQVNQGRIGVAFSFPPNNDVGYQAGTYQFAVVTFTINPNATALTAALSFGDQPARRRVLSPNLTDLTPGTTFVNGQIPLRTCATLTITPSTLLAATVGVPYEQRLNASGGTMNYSFALAAGSALPAGLTLAANGTVSGTPTTAGNFSFTVNVTDTNNCTGSAVIALAVACPTISINPPTLPNLVAGQRYEQLLTASGGTQEYRFAITDGALPSGLTLSAAGLIAGTSNASGSFPFTVTVTDGRGCPGMRTYTLSAGCAPITLSPASLPNGVTGALYTQTISVSGGGTYNFTRVGALPPGLTLAANGNLSGTPTAAGRFEFTVIATDPATNCAGQQGYVVTITCPTITINPPTLPGGRAGQMYEVLLSQAGGSGTLTWSVSVGSLPNGLTLNATTGVLSGTPLTFGMTSLTIRVSDANGCVGTRPYTLTLDPPACPTLTVNPASLPNGAVGAVYSASLSQTGGSGTLTWSVSAGALPGGLTLNAGSGLISGTPSAPGAFPFAARVTDANNCGGTRDYTVTVTCSFALNPTSRDVAASGGNATVNVTAANGCAWTAVSNAPWLIISSGGSGASGNGTVSFNAAANTGAARSGSLTIAGINFAVTQPAANTATLATVSAATFRAALAPESIAAAFGVNLATQTVAATSTPLPTTLAGTTLRVRDSAGVERPAPLFFVSPGQINYQVPAGTALGVATLTVVNGNGQSSSGTAQIALVSPGFFAANANGQGVPTGVVFRIRANGEQVIEPLTRFEGGQFVPAPIDLGPAGDQVVVVLFGTGLRGRRDLNNTSLTIGGVSVPVAYAGPQGDLIGLDQCNAGPLPRALAGRGLVELALTVEGLAAPIMQLRFQ